MCSSQRVFKPIDSFIQSNISLDIQGFLEKQEGYS